MGQGLASQPAGPQRTRRLLANPPCLYSGIQVRPGDIECRYPLAGVALLGGGRRTLLGLSRRKRSTRSRAIRGLWPHTGGSDRAGRPCRTFRNSLGRDTTCHFRLPCCGQRLFPRAGRRLLLGLGRCLWWRQKGCRGRGLRHRLHPGPRGCLRFRIRVPVRGWFAGRSQGHLRRRHGGLHRSGRRDLPRRHDRPDRINTDHWLYRFASHHWRGRFRSCRSPDRTLRSSGSRCGGWRCPSVPGRRVQTAQVFFGEAPGASGRRACRHAIKSPQFGKTRQRRALGRRRLAVTRRRIVHQRSRIRRHRPGRRPGSRHPRSGGSWRWSRILRAWSCRRCRLRAGLRAAHRSA